MQTETLAFYVQFQLKPECVDEWKRAVTELTDRMAQEPAFVCCYLNQEAEDATRFSLYECWHEASVESFLANQVQARDYRLEYEARLAQWLASPRVPTVLSCLRGWQPR